MKSVYRLMIPWPGPRAGPPGEVAGEGSGQHGSSMAQTVLGARAAAVTGIYNSYRLNILFLPEPISEAWIG